MALAALSNNYTFEKTLFNYKRLNIFEMFVNKLTFNTNINVHIWKNNAFRACNGGDQILISNGFTYSWYKRVHHWSNLIIKAWDAAITF